MIQPLLEEPAVKVAKAIPQEHVHMMTSRQVPGAQTVQKTFENQQKQSVDMVVNMPVAAEHQVPTVQRAQRTVEVLKVFIDNVVDVRVMQRLVSIQSTQEAVEVRRVQFTDKMVDEPAVMQGSASTVQARDGPDARRKLRRVNTTGGRSFSCDASWGGWPHKEIKERRTRRSER